MGKLAAVQKQRLVIVLECDVHLSREHDIFALNQMMTEGSSLEEM